MVIVVDVLKDACQQALAQTRGLAGTAKGKRKFGRGAGGDLSTKIDLVAEQAVIETVRSRGMNPTIIGEECGMLRPAGREGKQTGYLIMDGVDGTTNAGRGIPFFCCSLAYATDFKLSSVIDSAIIDLVSGDLYYASKGQGAFLNGKRISVKHNVGRDLVVGMNISTAGQDAIRRVMPLMLEAGHIRNFGANALELCLFARGLMDAYVDFRGKIRATDMAGAYLIVKEAGGLLYSADGSELDSDLGVQTRMSFLAVPNEKAFKRLAPDLGLD